MKPIGSTRRLLCAALALGSLFLTTRAGASAGDSHQSYSLARVIAHLPLSSGGARQMFLRQEGRTLYLYVQQPSRQGFTVINVTKPGQPKVVRRLPLETRTIMGSGLVVTETPDLSKPSDAPDNAEGARAKDTVPELVHVLNISDLAHPQTVPTLDGVSSTLQDPARDLIYVVNGEGVWILSRQQTFRRHRCSSSDAISNMPSCD